MKRSRTFWQTSSKWLPDSISADTNIVDDLGADSLDVVELIMSVEDEFGISIPDEDATELMTVGKIVEYIEAKL